LESVRLKGDSEKMIIGNLTMDKEDITLNTIDVFKKEIAKAGTIVLAGVLGKYEDEGHSQGTKEIFEAVASSSAYKIAGGGDTEKAIRMLNVDDKFDWISVGGGAMVKFLISKTLPGIESLKQ
jgi:phosphoglycerate kinase